MYGYRRFPVWTGILMAGVCVGPATALLAATVPLSDLLVPGATLTSHDGTVVFSEFAYSPTVNAPDALDVNVVTDASVPQGFKVQGVFQAFDGVTANALFGFEADLVQAGRVFSEAELALMLADTVGVQSGVSIVELVTTPLSADYEMFAVFDTPVSGVHYNSAPLAGFGDSITVLKAINVSAGPGGNPPGTFASISLFSQNFLHVPEPASLLLLLGCGLVLARRRQRTRGPGFASAG